LNEEGEEEKDESEEDESEEDEEPVEEDVDWVEVEDDYTPNEIPFTGAPSINHGGQAHPTPGELFNLLITDDIIDYIVRETNNFADNFLQEPASTDERRKQYKEWVPVDPIAMKQFLGLVLLMGYIKKTKISDYWSIDPVVSTSFVSTIMTRRCFQYTLKFLHFDSAGPTSPNDRMFKLRTIHNKITDCFMEVRSPGREVSIDEELMLWRGRLIFRQYIPCKSHKYGIKLYMLCVKYFF